MINLTIIMIFFAFIYIVGTSLKKIVKIQYNSILIGFLAVLAIFQITYYIAVFLKVPTIQYYQIITAVYIILTTVAIVNIKAKKIKFLPIITKDTIAKLSLVFFIWITTLLYGKTNSDTWLFLPLSLSSLQNGTIDAYYANIHAFDGYYGFISYVTHFTKSEYTMFIANWWTLIQAALVVLSYDAILKHLRIKNHLLIVSIMTMATFLGLYFILPYFGTQEVTLHIYNILPSGTLFFYICTIPLIVLTMLEKKTSYLMLSILLISSFAFSSSSLFVFGYLILIMWVFLYITKSKGTEKYQRLFLIMIITCINGVLYAIYADVDKILIIATTSTLLFAVLGYIYFAYLYKHYKADTIKQLLFILSLCVITLTWLNYLFVLGNPWQQFSAIFTKTLSDRNVPFNGGFQNIALIVIWTSSYIYIWKIKRYRKYSIFTITTLITYCNASMYLGTFQEIQPVYHRTIMLLSLYWYPLLALDLIIKKQSNRIENWITKPVLMKILPGIIVFAIVWIVSPNLYFSDSGMYNPLEESYKCFKVDNNDVCEILNTIDDSEANIYSEEEGKHEINKVFWYNTNYHRVDTIPESDYYIIPKTSKLKYNDEIIVETDEFFVYKN